MPVNLPLVAGKTSPTAFAAPVDDGIVDAFEADGFERGGCGVAGQEADADVAEAGFWPARDTVGGDFEQVGAKIVAALLDGGDAEPNAPNSSNARAHKPAASAA